MASSLVPSMTTLRPSPSVVSTPPPGTWQHPSFDEISRRQNAATFSDKNIWKITWNIGALVVIWLVENGTQSLIGRQVVALRTPPLVDYAIILLRALLMFNIMNALLPLFRRKDDLSDIPLTPSQRALLGLDPNATPPFTPGTQFITPPRYPRSTTSRSGTPGSRKSSIYADSPLARKDPSQVGRQGSESPFSSVASPLWQRTVRDNQDTNRRHSYGSPSSPKVGNGGREEIPFGAAHTPSPPLGRGASVALNSRWLYERGRSSSGSRSIYS